MWLNPLLRILSPGSIVLDIGCGPGTDSRKLHVGGHTVVAFDLDARSLLRCRGAAPAALLLRADVRSSLPFRDGTFDSAISSLSLHYFDGESTLRAFADIHRVLRGNAPFLFRVNADDDVNFGAGTGTEG